MIFYLNALHVLTADIKDTVNIRLEEGCRIVVSNSLNLTHIKLKCCLNKCFTVASGTSVGNCNVIRHLLINFTDCANSC